MILILQKVVKNQSFSLKQTAENRRACESYLGCASVCSSSQGIVAMINNPSRCSHIELVKQASHLRKDNKREAKQ